MTLLQRRTPQRLMGRVSTAAEVVMTVPSAVSLALGAALVTVVDWRWIFLVIGVATLAGAGHVAFWLRDQLVRRDAEPEPVEHQKQSASWARARALVAGWGSPDCLRGVGA